MPSHYPCCNLHHRHCPHHQSAPPPLLLPLPSFPGPDPEGSPLAAPPPVPNRDSTDLTSHTRWKAKTYGATKAAKSTLSPPPPPQYSSERLHNCRRRVGGQRQMAVLNGAHARGTTTRLLPRRAAARTGASSTWRPGGGGPQSSPTASLFGSPIRSVSTTQGAHTAQSA